MLRDVVSVLEEEIVEIKAPFAFGFLQDLEHSKIGIAAPQFLPGAIIRAPVVHNAGEADSETGYAQRHHCHGGAATPYYHVERADDEQGRRSKIHRYGIGQEWDEDVADEHRAHHASKSANGRQAPHVTPDVAYRHGENPHKIGPNHGKKRQRNKK